MRLIPIDPVLAENLAAGTFEDKAGPHLGSCTDLVRQVVSDTLAMLVRSPRAPVLGGYLALGEDDAVVGTCGFRHGPSSEGEIEIAYFTFPPYEGQGHATRMARELIAIALGSGSVKRVFAHTLPERSASTRVLEKVGMRLRGPVEDAEDGTVWRWDLDSP